MEDNKTTPPVHTSKTFKFGFNIGTDPEFQLETGNKRLSAGQTVDALFSQNKKYKLQGQGYDVPSFGNIGWDGHDSTGEFRPNPAKNPYELIQNLEGLIKDFSEKANFLKITTLSYGSPLGGHIHLELDNDIAGNPTILDRLQRRLAFMYIPLMLNDNISVLRKRLANNFGGFCDKRVDKRSNEKYTLEFRTPSAEWLTTKEIAEATIAYIATVWHEFINHPENVEKHSNCFFTDNQHAQNIQKLPLKDFMMFINIMCSQSKNIIKTFETYKIFKNEIDFITNNKRVIDIKNKAKFDIVTGWNIKRKETSIPSKKILLSEKKTETLLQNKNTEFLKKFIKIHIDYERAEELGGISGELKRKFIAFDWIPKQEIVLQMINKTFEKVIIRLGTQPYFFIKTEKIKENNDLQAFQNHTREEQGSLDNRPSAIWCMIPDNTPQKEAIKQIITALKDIESGNLKANPYTPEELKPKTPTLALREQLVRSQFRHTTFESIIPIPEEFHEESSDPSEESIRPMFQSLENDPMTEQWRRAIQRTQQSNQLDIHPGFRRTVNSTVHSIDVGNPMNPPNTTETIVNTANGTFIRDAAGTTNLADRLDNIISTNMNTSTITTTQGPNESND